MPFTPYHWGFALLIGRRFEPKDRLRVTLFGLMAISFPDLEGFANVILGMNEIAIHGPLHSFFSATLIGLTIAFFVKIIWKNATIAEFGTYILLPTFGHISIDLLIYPDMHPFWPFLMVSNPFLVPFGAGLAISLCLVAYLIWSTWLIWDWLGEAGIF